MDQRVEQAIAEEMIGMVSKAGGMLLKDLVREMANKMSHDPNRPSEFLLTDIINDVVKNKGLIEIEYTIDMSDVKSFLLPPRTLINIRGQEEKIRRI